MGISIICACKNRYDALRLSLHSWLHFDEVKEIIIADWSSDEPLEHLVDLDPRIKVVRVNNEEKYVWSHALNLAASLATQDYILKFDCDYVLNPYVSFFDQFSVDENSFLSGLTRTEQVEFYNEELGAYAINYREMSIEEVRDYCFSYSPFFKFLKGILFVSRENFNKVGGYDESIDTYGWEDSDMIYRLELLGLQHKTISFNYSIIHLPHPDRKRFIYSKNYNSELEEYHRQNVEQKYSGEEVQWQLDYVIAEHLIQENKRVFEDIKSPHVEKVIQWRIENMGDRKYLAKKNLSKLSGFPTVYYVSLDESTDRQQHLRNQFNQYQIEPQGIISKRFVASSDKVTGLYVHTLNDGTKGCAVSHLKAIKEWYNTTDEEYGFFCEDDLSLETVEHWNFTWTEFIETLPKDWQCVQLMSIRGEFDRLNLREREWDDWSVTAYIMKRDYAKRIIDTHIKENSYHLECSNPEIQPLIETILFTGGGKVYTIPLFVEDIDFESTFEGYDGDVKDGQKRNHYYTHNRILELWQNNTKSIQTLMAKTFTIKAKVPKRSMIVDYFIYFNEKELLELRINMLKDYVDKFVIVDSDRTFTGNPKPFTCKDTLKDLGLWDENKIEVVELKLHSNDDVVEYTANDRFYNNNDEAKMRVGSRERIQRDGLMTIIDKFDDDTIFIISDCDEIINPQNIAFISSIVKADQTKIIKIPLVYLQGRSDLRVYNTETNSPYAWDCSMFMATKKQLLVHGPNDIRSNFNICYGVSYVGEGLTRYEDLGWHFSWMGGTDRNKIKSHSYSHYDHEFDFIVYKKCSGKEMDSFIESHVSEEGSIAVSGHVNSVLKKYPTDKLPKEIFELPRVKEFLLPQKPDKTFAEELFTRYSLDSENPDLNFEVASWYDTQGHTAPALSYYLRCAERAEDNNLAYESLIKGSSCYERQGTRDGSAKSMLEQALCLMPTRPEAYYLLARFAEHRQWWQDCYIYANQALMYADFDSVPLRTDVDYPGKYGILFQKALSGWWWGKAEEARNLMLDIKKNYEVSEKHLKIIDENLVEMGIDSSKHLEKKSEDFNFHSSFDWGNLSYEDMITIDREIIHEKVYRFWRDVKEGDIVVDVGASVGPFTCSIAANNPEKVYCLEPSKNLIETLKKNCSEYYKNDELVFVNKAIVNSPTDEIKIFGGDDQQFDTTTFQSFIEDNKIKKINFLKIDCEGGEYSIFRDENMFFLLNNVEFIAMEVHLNWKDYRTKFKNFRDKYLIHFSNYKVMSCTRQNISWGTSIDIKEKIFDNDFIDNYTCEFMIYIWNEKNIL